MITNDHRNPDESGQWADLQALKAAQKQAQRDRQFSPAELIERRTAFDALGAALNAADAQFGFDSAEFRAARQAAMEAYEKTMWALDEQYGRATRNCPSRD